MTERVQGEVAALRVENLLCRQYLAKSAAAFSPTNFNRFRDMLHGAWWLIALEAYDDAKRLLDALCEVDDDFYWMFEWLASTFATRAWLYSQQGNTEASQADAEAVCRWLARDPNAKPLRVAEYHKALERCDIWYTPAENDSSVKSSASMLCTALTLLVLYQQMAQARAEPEEAQGYAERITVALALLKQKLTSTSR
ncbi:hypothetical protein [Armatimonas rosea]|uniref:hypothetical protein n=1 Tax=Armatimonas rosea TaxID=685828 RepID=UPI00161E9B34|nr:hypothetical protein [Armatimonas rosea]